MLEDLPEGLPLEKPLHKKKVRTPQKSRKDGSISWWSSQAIIKPEPPSPEKFSVLKEPPAPEDYPMAPIEHKSVPSPAMHMEYGGSGVSPRTVYGGTPRGSRSGTPRSNPGRKRVTFTPESSSSSIGRGLRDAKTTNVINYGSEEDEDDDEDEGDEGQVIVVPRSLRMYVQNCFDDDADSEGIPAADATISLAWPPSCVALPTTSPPTQSPATASPSEASSSSASQLDHNLNKFDFEWREFTSLQISPEETQCNHTP
ncbi:hypothetical protein O0L34_g10747 [Tuta absoluta]|nr:hypothetical protein O0L34_g10747 [Tuta absoluta]